MRMALQGKRCGRSGWPRTATCWPHVHAIGRQATAVVASSVQPTAVDDGRLNRCASETSKRFRVSSVRPFFFDLDRATFAYVLVKGGFSDGMGDGGGGGGCRSGCGRGIARGG